MMLNIFFVYLIAIDQSPVWVEPALKVGRDLNQVVPQNPRFTLNRRKLRTDCGSRNSGLSQIPTGDPCSRSVKSTMLVRVLGDAFCPATDQSFKERERLGQDFNRWSLSRGATLQVRSRGSDFEYSAKDLYRLLYAFSRGSNIQFRLVGEEQDYVDLNSVM